MWEHSSAGRASALQAEGHRFEPYCSHHYGLVVQLVRTLACHARGRRFDPDPGRQFASVAQSVEQGTENPRVIGSIPIGGTTSKVLSFIEKSCKQDFRDEYQTFSSSPQNLASQAFAGAPLKRTGGCKDKCTEYAAVAHLVERHLAKVEVASSSLVGRSNTKPSLMQKCKNDGFFVVSRYVSFL